MHPVFRIIQGSLRHLFDPLNAMDQGAAVEPHDNHSFGDAALILDRKSVV